MNYYPHGSRRAYLRGLAEEYGLPRSVVFALADVLGPGEDFDGLITAIEDLLDSGEWEEYLGSGE